MRPRDGGLVPRRGGVYARNEIWISAALPDRGAQGSVVPHVARLRSGSTSGKRGRSLGKCHRVPRKDAMPVLPRDMPNASEFGFDELGLAVALDRVLGSAKKLTGARYGALCLLNDARNGLRIHHGADRR